MPFIDVEPQELPDAASRIRAALPDTLGSGGSLGASAGAAGRSDVSGAIESFLDRWATGLTNINQDAQHLANLLRRAGALYAQTEAGIVGAER